MKKYLFLTLLAAAFLAGGGCSSSDDDGWGVIELDVAVSPRGDLRMPSDACATLWMEELNTLS